MNASISNNLLETGDPAMAPKAFRACLGQFATGVAVITAQDAAWGGVAGMTVNSFSSVSLDPPLILWSIRTASSSAQVFRAAPTFAVNVLAANQTDIAHHFANSKRDRSADVDKVRTDAPVPLVHGAVAHLECTLDTEHLAGDHIILIGRVRRFHRYSGRPLLFVQGQYGIAEPHPDLVSDSLDRAETNQDALGSGDIIADIFDARNHLSRAFETSRLAEGVELAEGRVLRRVEERQGATWDWLSESTFLGGQELEDTITTLTARGWLHGDATNGLVLTDEGWRIRQSVKKRWKTFQEDQIRGIPASDLVNAMAVLRKITAQTPRADG